MGALGQKRGQKQVVGTDSEAVPATAMATTGLHACCSWGILHTMIRYVPLCSAVAEAGQW